jgi:hypothetical protein
LILALLSLFIYVTEILEENNEMYFQQDNAPACTAENSTQALCTVFDE